MITEFSSFSFLTGTADDLIELQDISISPDPPKPGEDLEVTVKGHVKERLEVCWHLLKRRSSIELDASLGRYLCRCTCENWHYQTSPKEV